MYAFVLVPVAAYAVGVALYSEGELNFWRVLAIVAVFHFVRQQYGWVALYRRKLGETERWTWWVDAAAVAGVGAAVVRAADSGAVRDAPPTAPSAGALPLRLLRAEVTTLLKPAGARENPVSRGALPGGEAHFRSL